MPHQHDLEIIAVEEALQKGVITLEDTYMQVLEKVGPLKIRYLSGKFENGLFDFARLGLAF